MAKENRQATFSPQFHKAITHSDAHTVWVALPYPYTLIPGKTAFYRRWQIEERQKLQEKGDVVLAFAISH